MDPIVWEETPRLDDPAALIAFQGWGDAGSSSSMAVQRLMESLAGYRFAHIDPDEFFDFQVRRPTVEIDDSGARGIEWPDVTFHHLYTPAGRDLVVVTGDEPSTRWKAFTAHVAGVLRTVGVHDVVTMGAFIGQVPHTLPVPLIGVGSEPGMVERLGLFASAYEGPTGIIGVLNQALAKEGFSVVSLWAAVPHYLSNQTYPPGGLALLGKALEILGVTFDLSGLSAASAEFRHKVDAALAESDLRDYVAGLEAEALTGQEGVDPGARLVEEIERFLKED